MDGKMQKIYILLGKSGILIKIMTNAKVSTKCDHSAKRCGDAIIANTQTSINIA